GNEQEFAATSRSHPSRLCSREQPMTCGSARMFFTNWGCLVPVCRNRSDCAKSFLSVLGSVNDHVRRANVDLDELVQCQDGHDLPGPATRFVLDSGVREEPDAPVEEQRVPGGKEDAPDCQVHERPRAFFSDPSFRFEPLEV